MSRSIYLIVFNSPLFPAHWALWVPHSDTPATGTYLNATGDAATGFTIEIERNYALGADGRRYQVILLAGVQDEHVVDVKGDGGASTDCIARDYLEEIALGVEPPGKSLVSVGDEVGSFEFRLLECDGRVY